MKFDKITFIILGIISLLLLILFYGLKNKQEGFENTSNIKFKLPNVISYSLKYSKLMGEVNISEYKDENNPDSFNTKLLAKDSLNYAILSYKDALMPNNIEKFNSVRDDLFYVGNVAFTRAINSANSGSISESEKYLLIKQGYDNISDTETINSDISKEAYGNAFIDANVEIITTNSIDESDIRQTVSDMFINGNTINLEITDEPVTPVETVVADIVTVPDTTTAGTDTTIAGTDTTIAGTDTTTAGTDTTTAGTDTTTAGTEDLTTTTTTETMTGSETDNDNESNNVEIFDFDKYILKSSIVPYTNTTVNENSTTTPNVTINKAKESVISNIKNAFSGMTYNNPSDFIIQPQNKFKTNDTSSIYNTRSNIQNKLTNEVSNGGMLNNLYKIPEYQRLSKEQLDPRYEYKRVPRYQNMPSTKVPEPILNSFSNF